MGLYAYSLQVYCDFSGYTDMATGLALLMGFHLPKNFNSPYKAKNTGEFWKRWHMSLSSWIRDYVFLPLASSVVCRRPRIQLSHPSSGMKPRALTRYRSYRWSPKEVTHIPSRNIPRLGVASSSRVS